jgi:hypothetical protein
LQAAGQFCNGRRGDRANSRDNSRGTRVAPVGVVPKKQQIKLSPDRSGRRVRWTFEVSTDVDTEKRPRAKKPAKKRTRATSSARRAGSSAREHREADPVTPPPTATAPVAAPVPAATVVEPMPTAVAAPVLHATPHGRTTGREMGMVAGIAVLVIATMAVPRWPTSDIARSEQQEPEQRAGAAGVQYSAPNTDVPSRRPPATAPRPVVKTRAVTESAKKPSVVNATNRTTRPTPPASLSANATVVTAKASTAEPVVPEPTPATPSPAPGVSLSPVTITGCLEISTDGNDFRLADTEGADAPKSRSWRTGFLRKRTAPVALAGVPDPLALRNSVGQRVAATGLLTSRELQVSSLRVVAASCN